MLDDAVVAAELAAIADRLRDLAADGADQETVGRELGAIRAELRLLANENAEVAARLGAPLALRMHSDRSLLH